MSRDWWGRDTVAHLVDVETGRTACGNTLDLWSSRKPYTRLTQDTGEPWPRCKECIKRSGQSEREDPK